MKIADVILHVKDRGPIRYERMVVVEFTAAVEIEDADGVTRADAYLLHFDPFIKPHLVTYLDACGGDVQVRLERLYLPGGRRFYEVHIEPMPVVERKTDPTKPTVAPPSAAWFSKGGNA